MYGMIRNALRDLVVAHHGPAVWEAVCRRAGQSPNSVLALDAFPDAEIFALVKSASEELGASPPALLETFGEHWIDYAKRSGYRDYLDGIGDTLAEFLSNLDELHARITLMMPQLLPPQFAVRDLGDGGFELKYTSARRGMSPMVIGIVRGLARYKGRGVRIELARPRGPGENCDTFLVHEWPLASATDAAA
jgi:hypothetical protein